MIEPATTPRVSVIIPCYNQGRFLSEAIESVRRQTFRDYEILVVDDGSTDETSAIASSAPDVRHLSGPHRGVAAARNSGLRAARSPYVTFLDADDRLLPDALEVAVRCIESRPQCAFVSGHYRIISADGTHLRLGPRACVGHDHYRELLRRNYIGMNAAVLFRRAFLDEIGGYDPSLRGCEDYDVYLRLARNSPVFCHDRLVAEYRHHDSNASRDLRLMLRTSIRILRRQRPHLRDEHERAACREGLREYRRRYGDPLLDEALDDLRSVRRWSPAIRRLLFLARYRPAGTARRVVRRAGQWMTRQRRRIPI